MACGMGKLKSSDAIANRINMRFGRLHHVIYADEALMQGNIRVLKPNILDICLPPNRYQQLVRLQIYRTFTLRCGDNHTLAVLNQCACLYLIAGHNFNSAALQLFLQFTRHLFILIWKKL
ncbi:hypothetical protein D3C77_448450 [compost metagenome]